MSPFEIIFSVSFLLALWAGVRRFDQIAGERKALAAKCAELEGKTKKQEEDSREALNRVREYYDREIEGQKKQIEELKHMLVRADILQKTTELNLALERSEKDRVPYRDYIPGADAGS